MGVKKTCVVKFIRKGDTGAKGEQGAVLRGPQAWSDCATGYAFKQGAPGEAWLDVVLYNDYYYYCKKSHVKTSSNYPGSTTAENQGLWQLGDSIGLVATRILLAQYALVKNLGVEAIDMRDGNGNAIFQAKDGNVTCKTGTFENVTVKSGTIGGFDITDTAIGTDGATSLHDQSSYLENGRLSLDSFDITWGARQASLNARKRGNNMLYLECLNYASMGPLAYLKTSGAEAIRVVSGMFAGLRPKIYSQTTGTLSYDQNVIIANNSGASTLYLPSSPEKGQMYLIYHLTSNNLTIHGNGKSIKRLTASGLTTVTDTYSGSIEVIMCNWDGSYWYLTYIKVS